MKRMIFSVFFNWLFFTLPGWALPPMDDPFFSPELMGGPPPASMEVIFDKTTDAKYSKTAGTATVLINGKQVAQYKISAGKDVLKRPPKGPAFCAITPTGSFTPKRLEKDKVSRESNNAPMPFYIELDSNRGLGAHAGDVSGLSGGCIRQPADRARWLFDEVKKVSSVGPGGKIIHSQAIFRIVDHTPADVQARILSDCEKKLGRKVTAQRADPRKLPIAGSHPILPTERFQRGTRR